jgi:hypothetical protein
MRLAEAFATPTLLIRITNNQAAALSFGSRGLRPWVRRRRPVSGTGKSVAESDAGLTHPVSLLRARRGRVFDVEPHRTREGTMELLIARCAGVDVHQTTVVAAVRTPDEHGGRRRVSG